MNKDWRGLDEKFICEYTFESLGEAYIIYLKIRTGQKKIDKNFVKVIWEAESYFGMETEWKMGIERVHTPQSIHFQSKTNFIEKILLLCFNYSRLVVHECVE